jgi:hypothetical protein
MELLYYVLAKILHFYLSRWKLVLNTNSIQIISYFVLPKVFGNLSPNIGGPLLGGLVLNYIPVFNQNPVFDWKYVSYNPVHRLEARKPSAEDY